MEEYQVNFKNSKNQKIFGILHVPGKGKNYPAIIICHGLPRDKIGQDRIHVRTARAFCKEKFVVLRFDFSGMGDSEGEFEKVTHKQALDDLNSALDYLNSLHFIDKNKIGIVGHSFGGEIALLKAIKDPKIKTLVLHAPRIDWRAVWTKEKIRKSQKTGYIEEGSLRLGLDYLEYRLKYLPIKDALGVRIPILIIHGTNDKAIDYRDSVKFIKKSKSSLKRILLIKGADHDFSKYIFAEKLIKETVDWFKNIFYGR